MDSKDISFLYDCFLDDETFKSIGGDLSLNSEERMMLVDELTAYELCDFEMIKQDDQTIGFWRVDKAPEFFVFHIFIIEAYRLKGKAREILNFLIEKYYHPRKKIIIMTINASLAERMKSEENFTFLNQTENYYFFEVNPCRQQSPQS